LTIESNFKWLKQIPPLEKMKPQNRPNFTQNTHFCVFKLIL